MSCICLWGQPNQVSHNDKHPLSLPDGTSSSRKYNCSPLGLLITICFEVDRCVKGHDIYIIACVLQGLWLYLLLDLHINIISLPSFAFPLSSFH